MIKFFTSKVSPDRLLILDESQQKAIEFQSESNIIFPLTTWGKTDEDFEQWLKYSDYEWQEVDRNNLSAATPELGDEFDYPYCGNN